MIKSGGGFSKEIFRARDPLCQTLEAMSDFDDDLMEDDDEYDLVNYITFIFDMRAIVRAVQCNSK